MGGGILNTYQRFETLADFISLAANLNRMIQGGGVTQAMLSSSGEIKGGLTSDVVQRFMQNAIRGISAGALNWSKGYITSMNKSKLKSFQIYMPHPGTGTGNFTNVETGIKIPIKRGKSDLKSQLS